MAELLRDGCVAPGVPVITGATAQDLRFLRAPLCPLGPHRCTRANFRSWAAIVRRTVYPQLDADALESLYEGTASPGGGEQWSEQIRSGVDPFRMRACSIDGASPTSICVTRTAPTSHAR